MTRIKLENKGLCPASDMPEKVCSAAARLEAFAQLAIKKQGRSALTKTVGLMRKLLKRALRWKSDSSKTELMCAIETINKHRIDIRSFNVLVASSIRNAIDSYNQSLNHAKNGGDSLRLPHINIPRISLPMVRHFPGSQVVHQATSPMISYAAINTTPLPEQTADLFRMKVLSLLNRYEIATNPQARYAVIKSPITTTANDRFCLLTQTVKVFPWETVTVQGASELDPFTQTISRLFPETFSVSLVSEQTAYPHPTQRAGWVLSEYLIPELPQRLDLLPAHASLFSGRKELLEQLLAGKEVNQVAKKLFRIKQRVFQSYIQEFAFLHEKLAQAVFCAGGASSFETKSFFACAQQEANSFDFIGDTYQQIREIWMKQPYQKVVEEQQKPELIEASFKASHEEIEADLIRDIEEAESEKQRIQLEWILNYGSLVGKASVPIMLQHLSEDFDFEPPKLTHFQTQLQTVACRHLADYMTELNQPEFDDTKMYQAMKRQLTVDCETFQRKEKSRVAADLEGYFALRYRTRQH